jgi:hypothetical protein
MNCCSAVAIPDELDDDVPSVEAIVDEEVIDPVDDVLEVLVDVIPN